LGRNIAVRNIAVNFARHDCAIIADAGVLTGHEEKMISPYPEVAMTITDKKRIKIKIRNARNT
jgi:hypothetical protein